MRKKLGLFLVALMCIFVTPALTTQAAESNIIENNETGIPDENLYQWVLYNLGKGLDEKITKEDAESITSLYTNLTDEIPVNIKSIKGIAQLKNLESLAIDDTNIDTLEGMEEISGLPKLKNLTFRNCQLTTLEPIRNCTELETLEVQNSQLTGLQGIEGLTKLRTLSIDRNQIRSLNGIENCEKMKFLSAKGNKIESLKPLAKMKKMETLQVQQNKLKNLKGIEDFKFLEDIYVTDNQLTSLKELKNFKFLGTIEASGNRLKNLEGMKKLPALRSLYVNRNKLTGLNGVENLTNLVNLYADHNELTGLKEIKKLKKLLQASFRDNRIKSEELKVITDMKMLKGIDVSYNELKTLPDLRKSALYPNLSNFQHNRLSEEEIRNKLPKRFFKMWKGILEDTIAFQNLDYRIKLTNPKSKKKIKSDITTIKGKVFIKDARIQLYNTDKNIGTQAVKADKKGKFVLTDLKLTEWVGDDVTIQILLYNKGDKEYVPAGEGISFKVVQ